MAIVPPVAQNREFVPDPTFSPDGGETSWSRAVQIGLASAVIGQVVLLIVAGWHNRHMFEHDAVAYLRIASYTSRGQLHLMVSGYWGPLLSWFIAPFLWLGASPQDAARIAMGLSGLLFLLGCVPLFRNLQLHPVGVVLGTWIVALASIYWSVSMITPDLLLSGMLALAVSQLISSQWARSRRTPFLAGLLGGGAYLAKGVGFPVFLGASVCIASLWVLSRQARFKVALRSLGITLAGFAIVAGPWVATLSWKYHGFVISTAARINYAVIGPPDRVRGHPAVYNFHKPESGRLASIEDYTYLPYEDWSPFQSLSYAKHQLWLLYKNAYIAINTLKGFDPILFGLISALCGLLIHAPWRENLSRERWRWAGMPIACICGIYLPIYTGEDRYFLPAYPFLIAASVGMVVSLTRHIQRKINWPRLLGLSFVAILLFDGAVHYRLLPSLRGLENPSAVYTYELAERLKAAGLQGSMAGVGNYQGWPVQYVETISFYLDQPYYGHELNPTPEQIKSSGAKLIFILRHKDNKSLIKKLDKDPMFRALDHVLFKSEEKSNRFPVKVYQIYPS